MRYLRTNTATRITVGPFFDKTDGVTPETAITVTSCKLTFMVDTANVPTLILDVAPTASGGANDMVHVTGDDAGFYDLELAAADVNYLGRAMLAITDAAVHCPVFHELMILPAVVYDAMILGTDLFDVSVTQILGTAVSTPATAGVLDVNVKNIDNDAASASGTVTFPNATLASTTNITAGTITTVTTTTTATNVTTVNGLAANVITATSINADAITAAKIADGAIDAATFAAGAINAAAIAADAIGASELAADAITEIQSGLATAAALATVQADTDNIQTRLPAALSGDGFMKADLLSIGDELVSGNNATLNLKRLNIVNATDSAINILASGINGNDAIDIESQSGTGLWVTGDNYGIYTRGAVGMSIYGNVDAGLDVDGTTDGANFYSSGLGKSISALDDIAVSDGDLTLAAIADATWDEATAGHATAGTTGKALTDAGSAGDPWGTALPGAYGAGTAGKIIGDNVNATVSSRATQTSVDDLPTNAELATSQAAADDDTLAAITALNNITAADVWASGTRTLTSFGTLVADIWANATRTLTAISDSSGITILLSRIAGALNITGGKAEVNVKQINGTNVTGDGSATPWGPE